MKYKLVILCFLFLMLVTSVGCDWIKGYDSSSLQLEPKAVGAINVSATFGNKIDGYFTVTGGEGSVLFWAESPSGVPVLDVVVIFNSYEFLIDCYEEGYYKLYFSNPTSVTGRNVYVRHRLR